MAPILEKYGYPFLEGVLKSLGIELTANGDYVYPLSESAPSYALYLKKLAEKVGVTFVTETRVLDYKAEEKEIEVKTDKKSFIFDKLVIATGGKSDPKLGSDGSFYEILKKHGYSIVEPIPGLTPLTLNDKDIKPLAGVRHKANVKAFLGKEKIFDENGEVLYKNDGISGIVIFNAESAIYRHQNPKDIELVVDLFPEWSFEELMNRLAHDEALNSKFYLDSYLVEPLQKHVLSRSKGNDALCIATSMKNLRYSVKDHYGFDYSQVTIGGLSLNEVDENLSSIKEKGVYLIGELLDVDGDCGGYNLTWSLLSAIIVFKAL
jgi:predicted Rossmann fold flavoprotein